MYGLENKNNSLKLFAQKVVLFFALLISFPVLALAWNGLPFAPGTMINPDCLPTDPNCDVRSISAVAPVLYSTSTGIFSISQASSTANGYLSSDDWSIFSNKQNSLGNLLGIVVGDGSGNYSTTTDNSSNWNTTYGIVNSSSSNWNSAYNTITSSSTFWDTAYSWGNHAGLYDLLGTATTTLNNWLALNPTSGANTGDETQTSIKNKLGNASSTSDGYLTFGDWNIFNSKENAITAGTVGQYFRGDKTFQNLDTSVVPENGNLYFTNDRADARANVQIGAATSTVRNFISNGSGILYSAITGIFSLDNSGNWAGTWQSFNPSDFFKSASTTDNLTQGSINKYYSTSLFNTDLGASTSTVRNFFSSTANGLIYTPSTGIFSLDSNYNIPLSASTTNWDNTYKTVTASSTNWDTAYNTVNASSTFWDTAYSWGNYATAGYLSSVLASSTYAKLTGAIFTGDISALNFSGSSSGANTGDETQTTIKTKLGAAASGVDGYLSGSDWNTFSGKQNTITTGTTGQYLRGDLSLATFPTALSSFSNDSNFITNSNGLFVNNATDSTLTRSGTGPYTLGLNLGNANTWTGQQTFNTSAPIFGTMTAGSVLFAGTGGLLSQDNTNLAWDNTNKFLNVGGMSTFDSFLTFPLSAAAVANTFIYSGGYSFNVAEPILVTKIGRLYAAGNVQDHNFNIWISTNTSTPLATGTILAASASDAKNFKYATLGTPLILLPGNLYTVAIDETPTTGDTLVYNYTPPLNTPFVNISGRYGTASSGIYPNGAWGSKNAGQIIDTPDIVYMTANAGLSQYGITSNGGVTASTIALTKTSSTGLSGIIFQNNTPILHTYGTSNFFFGTGAGNFTLTGSSNVGLGNQTFFGLTSGSSNVAVGNATMSQLTTGVNNTSVGNGAFNGAGTKTTNDNTSLGAYSLVNTSGSQNVAIGSSAGYSISSAILTGSYNVLAGYSSGYGSGAGNSIGSYNTFLGANSGRTSSTTLNGITYGIGIGYDVQVGASNTAVIGGISGATNAVKVAIGAATAVSTFDINAYSASTIGQIIQGASSQTADLQEWRQSDATILSRVDANGFFAINRGQGTGSYLNGSAALDVTSKDSTDATNALIVQYNNRSAGGLGFSAGQINTTYRLNWNTSNMFMFTNGSTVNDAGLALGTATGAKINGRLIVYGRPALSGETGTVSTTVGSTTVTGVGTNMYVLSGSGFQINIGVNSYPVRSVTPDGLTATLYSPAVATVSGASWTVTSPVALFSSADQAKYIASDNLGDLIFKGTAPQMIFDRTGGKAWSIVMDGANNDRLAFKNTTNNTVPFYIDGSAPGGSLVVDSSGNVGIGTTPSAQLHTTGTVRFAALTGVGANLIVDSNGNVTVSSDERLKNIQGNFNRGLADLQNINPILFKWKPETGYDASSTYAGFSAQNIQANIPEAVATDAKGFLTLADRPILATLVNAVKEIGNKIASIMSWFGGDGSKMTIQGDVCVDDVCVTKDQFKNLLQNSGGTVNTSPVVNVQNVPDVLNASSTETSTTTNLLSPDGSANGGQATSSASTSPTEPASTTEEGTTASSSTETGTSTATN